MSIESGFGAFSARRASTADKLGVQGVRQTRDDLILHVEEIGERLIEPLGPEDDCRFRRR